MLKKPYIILILLIVISTIGISYSYWNDNLTVNGSIRTASLEIEIDDNGKQVHIDTKDKEKVLFVQLNNKGDIPFYLISCQLKSDGLSIPMSVCSFNDNTDTLIVDKHVKLYMDVFYNNQRLDQSKAKDINHVYSIELKVAVNNAGGWSKILTLPVSNEASRHLEALFYSDGDESKLMLTNDTEDEANTSDTE